jgi:hypothetical protein
MLFTALPHNCLTRAHWRKFPARKHFLKLGAAEFFREAVSNHKEKNEASLKTDVL